MKNDIEYFRKFKIIDFQTNPKKFNQYLDLCKKNGYVEEKIAIMQHLVNYTNEKSVSGDSATNEIISQITKQCILTVIYSDFEIENFWKIQNFSLNFQKTILIQAINFSLDKINDQNLIDMISLKYQFWVLKTVNKTAELTGNLVSNYISQDELNQSLINLEEEILKERVREKNFIFTLKAAYELGFYYYLKNNFEKMKIFFQFCLYKSNSLKEMDHKLLYFNLNDLEDLLTLLFQDNGPFISKANKDLKKIFFDENETSNKNVFKSSLGIKDYDIKNDNNQRFYNNNLMIENHKLTIFDQEKYDVNMEIEYQSREINENLDCDLDAINKKFYKFKFLQFKVEDRIYERFKLNFAKFFEKNAFSDENKKALIDKYSFNDSKTFETFSIVELVKYAKNLILISFKNSSTYLKKLGDYIPHCYNTLLSRNGGNLSDQEKKVFQSAEKDLAYFHHLINLIELIYKKEEKLPKKLLTNLSKTILDKTLTDDLEISGLIHGIVINFNKSSARVSGYFNDFVEFFQKSSSPDMIEKVNQITLFHIVLKIINSHIENCQESKQTIFIEGEEHSKLINLIFYWLKLMKENFITKKENILYLLIKTLKNYDYLKMLKILFFGAYKFLLDKKRIVNKDLLNDDIYEKINQSNINYLSIDSVFNENINCKNTKFRNKTIFFREDTKNNYSYFQIEDSKFYEEKIFELIKKCEKKIVNNYKFSHKKVLERKLNIIFFENCMNLLSESKYLVKPDLKVPEKNHQIKLDSIKISQIFPDILKEFINYFKVCISDFKIKYFNYDMFQNNKLNIIDELYENFKELINQDILMKLTLLLYFKGRNLDACILFQYIKDADYDVIFKILQKFPENHILYNLEFIWKVPYFEILANIYYRLRKHEFVNTLKNLLRRTSNHQFFKNHPLRKHFKIINFIKYLDYLDYSCFR